MAFIRRKTVKRRGYLRNSIRVLAGYAKWDGPYSSGPCPLQELLARLGDKWSMLVIMALAKNEIYCLRFSDLRKQVNGISQRMLTTTLRYRSSPYKTGQKHRKKREE